MHVNQGSEREASWSGDTGSRASEGKGRISPPGPVLPNVKLRSCRVEMRILSSALAFICDGTCCTVHLMVHCVSHPSDQCALAGGGIFDYPGTHGMNGRSGRRSSAGSSWSRANRSLFRDVPKTPDAQSPAADAFELSLMDSQRHSVQVSSRDSGLGVEAAPRGPLQAALREDKAETRMERSTGPSLPGI